MECGIKAYSYTVDSSVGAHVGKQVGSESSLNKLSIGIDKNQSLQLSLMVFFIR